MSFTAAIIGCGMIAREHVEALARIEGMNVAAYCDRDLERAQQFLHTYGGGYATDSVEQIMNDNGIDVVYICTFHDSHAELALKACNAGKHVMMEKPLALTITECRDICEAVERSGITFMTAFKLRFYPMVERARRFIELPILSIAQIMDTRWPDNFWAQQPGIGGGNFMSQGGHLMDLLYYLNRSEPTTVYAEGGAFTHPGSTLVDTAVATIRFANGSIASVAQADAGTVPHLSKFSFQLADGTKTAHLHNRLKTGVFNDGAVTEILTDETEMGMYEENRCFMESLVTGAAPPATCLDGLRATTMLVKAVESIHTGKPQEIRL